MAESSEDLFKKHLDSISKSQFIPENQFDHAYALLQKEEGDFDDFKDIHSQSRLLANISSDRIMVLLQKDVFFEVSFFDMGKRDSEVFSFFKFIRAFHREELNLTRSFKGKERILQTFSQPDTRGMGGFGEQLQKEIERRQREQQEGRSEFYG